MSTLPRFLTSWMPAFAVAFLLLLGLPSTSAAQTTSNVTVSVPAISFNIRRPDASREFPRVASRQDCLDSERGEDDWTHFEFTPTIVFQGVSAPMFEVWIGRSDCAEFANRNPGQAGDRCARIYSRSAVGLRGKVISISVRDVAHALNNLTTQPDSNNEEGFGTIDDCDRPLDLQKIAFYFLLTDSIDTKASDKSTDRFELDFVGPPPPVDVVARPGDGMLFPRWTPVDAVDLRGFRIYCSLGTSVGSGGGMGGAGGASGASCGSATLRPGELVPPGTENCGEILGQLGVSGGRAEPLENGATYAIGVTSFDRTRNESVLSELACGTPAEVTSFFEAYREAGGQGGGLCSLGGGVPTNLGLLVGLGTAGLTLLRRRRRA